MKGREIFAVDEWYHCYSRGVDKRIVFEDESDYSRFKNLLYLCNSTTSIHRSAIANLKGKEVYDIQRGEPLVAIGAYCLMPNHFHLLMRETREGGVSEFMRKVGIAYAMYFNIKHDRIGNLFVKPFRAKHVSDDDYFKRVALYIHLNPVELYEPGWKEGRIGDLHSLEENIRYFEYSSLPEYLAAERAEMAILDPDARDLIGIGMPNLKELIYESLLYYRDLPR
jgi:putative transposase